MQPTFQQECLCSFIDVLQEAPRVLQMLSPTAAKNLSATCRSLRTYFCAHVKLISLSDPADAAKLCCRTWPQLIMVVCSSTDLNSKLPAEWDYMVEVSIWSGSCFNTAVLIKSRQQLHCPSLELPSQYCAAVSDFADKHSNSAQSLDLKGPLVGCRLVQSLIHAVWPRLIDLHINTPQLEIGSMAHLRNLQFVTCVVILNSFLDAPVLLQWGTEWSQLRSISLSNNQLDASAISVMPQAKWSNLHRLELEHNMLGLAGTQHIVSCSLPCLQILNLKYDGIDDAAACCLAQGNWPMLRILDLDGNSFDGAGISYLVLGRWPDLRTMSMSYNSVDEKALSLLGIGEAYRPTFIHQTGSILYNSDLLQFPHLQVNLCKT